MVVPLPSKLENTEYCPKDDQDKIGQSDIIKEEEEEDEKIESKLKKGYVLISTEELLKLKQQQVNLQFLPQASPQQ